MLTTLHAPWRRKLRGVDGFWKNKTEPLSTATLKPLQVRKDHKRLTAAVDLYYERESGRHVGLAGRAELTLTNRRPEEQRRRESVGNSGGSGGGGGSS